MSLSNRDYLILALGLTLIVWISRHHLATLWRFVNNPTEVRRTGRTWRPWVLWGALILPSVGMVIVGVITQEAFFSLSEFYWIETVPVIAWSVYAAWLSQQPGRWLSIVKYRVLVGFSRILSVLSFWLTISSRDYFRNAYFEFRFVQIRDEALSCFVTVILLSSVARLFRFHLVRIDAPYQEPQRITIPFLLLTQTCLAFAISMIIWRNQSQVVGQVDTPVTVQFALAFTWSISVVLIALACLAPSRLPRWQLAPLLVISAIANRVLAWVWWFREMQKLEEFQSTLAANQMLTMIGRSLLIEFVFLVLCLLLIRFLFYKSGLVVKGVETPTDGRDSGSEMLIENGLVSAAQ